MDKKDMTRVNWSREETILAYELYCRTTFGDIKVDNPEIVELAKMIGRTPGSVKAKMNNLAHFDPELQEKNIEAMAHTSKLDGEIVAEFSKDWGGLAYQAQKIRANIQNKDLLDIFPADEIEDSLFREYYEKMLRVRTEQCFFRMTVLNSYANRCCITGLNATELLVASHIKPWNECDEYTERANPHNGLCLNSLFDQAFNLGFITISRNYKILISKKLNDADMDLGTKSWLWGYDKQQINLPEKFLPGKEFIEYHNDKIFRGK